MNEVPVQGGPADPEVFRYVPAGVIQDRSPRLDVRRRGMHTAFSPQVLIVVVVHDRRAGINAAKRISHDLCRATRNHRTHIFFHDAVQRDLDDPRVTTTWRPRHLQSEGSPHIRQRSGSVAGKSAREFYGRERERPRRIVTCVPIDR